MRGGVIDIKEKQPIWLKEKPLFEAELIHSHLLPFFNFNENTGDYEIKTESVNNTDEEDRKVAYESLNTGWAMWLRAKRTAKAQVPVGFVLVPKKSLKVALFWMNEDIDPWQMGHDSFADLFEHKPILEKVLIEAQEKNMNNQVCIGRHINNISINPLEYLLDESGQVKLFADEAAAKAHLAELGYSDEDAYWMVIKAQE